MLALIRPREDVGPTFRATQNCQHGDDDNVQQLVSLVIRVNARIFQILEMV